MIFAESFRLMVAGLVLLATATGSAVADSTDPELEQHTEKLMKAHTGAEGKEEAGGRTNIPREDAVSVQFALVTIRFTDTAMADTVGLDTGAFRKAAGNALADPQVWILRARQPVNLSVPHWWMDLTVALGSSETGDRHLFHVTSTLLHLSSSASTPKQNRYVMIKRESQKHIGGSEVTALQGAIEKSITELTARLLPRLLAPVGAANHSDRTPITE